MPTCRRRPPGCVFVAPRASVKARAKPFPPLSPVTKWLALTTFHVVENESRKRSLDLISKTPQRCFLFLVFKQEADFLSPAWPSPGFVGPSQAQPPRCLRTSLPCAGVTAGGQAGRGVAQGASSSQSREPRPPRRAARTPGGLRRPSAPKPGTRSQPRALSARAEHAGSGRRAQRPAASPLCTAQPAAGLARAFRASSPDSGPQTTSPRALGPAPRVLSVGPVRLSGMLSREPRLRRGLPAEPPRPDLGVG